MFFPLNGGASGALSTPGRPRRGHTAGPAAPPPGIPPQPAALPRPAASCRVHRPLLLPPAHVPFSYSCIISYIRYFLPCQAFSPPGRQGASRPPPSPSPLSRPAGAARRRAAAAGDRSPPAACVALYYVLYQIFPRMSRPRPALCSRPLSCTLFYTRFSGGCQPRRAPGRISRPSWPIRHGAPPALDKRSGLWYNANEYQYHLWGEA